MRAQDCSGFFPVSALPGFSTDNLVNSPCLYMIDFGLIVFLSVPIRVYPCYEVWHSSRNIWHNSNPSVTVCVCAQKYSGEIFVAFQLIMYSTLLVSTWLILVSFSSLVCLSVLTHAMRSGRLLEMSGITLIHLSQCVRSGLFLIFPRFYPSRLFNGWLGQLSLSVHTSFWSHSLP